MAMNIKLETKGIIKEGLDKGWYIVIQNDSSNVGSYLIICNQSLDMDSTQGSDFWVKDLKALEGFIEESGWIIEWLE